MAQRALSAWYMRLEKLPVDSNLHDLSRRPTFWRDRRACPDAPSIVRVSLTATGDHTVRRLHTVTLPAPISFLQRTGRAVVAVDCWVPCGQASTMYQRHPQAPKVQPLPVVAPEGAFWKFCRQVAHSAIDGFAKIAPTNPGDCRRLQA
jgi:hypothetical protein